jgi:hypothetical protein
MQASVVISNTLFVVRRYEVNPKYIDSFEEKGLKFVGKVSEAERAHAEHMLLGCAHVHWCHMLLGCARVHWC